MLGGTRDEIASGVSIGIKDSIDELVAAVKNELAAGYQRIKIKIKPGKDLEPVKRLRQDFPKIKLMVDANSVYHLDDWPLLKQLEGFYLMMIEQPLGWDDLYSHVELQKKLDTPICLDECIHTFEQAQAAIALRACKIINIKLGRVGGYTVARRIHDVCQTEWHARLVRRHAGVRNRPRAQHRPLDLAQFHACPATLPPADATGTKTSSNPK